MPKPGQAAASPAWPAVALPVLAMVCMGTFFGSTQAALSSFSAGFATSEAAGLLYAVMGISSAAAAISVAYWPAGFHVTARWVAGAAAMAGLSALLFLPTDGWGMVLVLLAWACRWVRSWSRCLPSAGLWRLRAGWPQ